MNTTSIESKTESALEIPTCDLQALAKGDLTAIQAIRKAFGTYGLVYIKNHGISSEELSVLYKQFRAFVSKPEAEKQKYNKADLWYQRGWTPPNTEVAVAAGGQPDFKECYFAAPMEGSPEMERLYPELYPQNVWPEGDPLFKDYYLKIGKNLHDVGLKLLEGASLSLGLPKDTFTAYLTGAPHVTRILHYLALSEAQVKTDILWGEEHTDFNLLTLLPGGQFYNPEGAPARKPEDKSGLFLRTRSTKEHPNGMMVPGKPPEGCIVAQVGQQLEILTGGEFVATPHVVTPPKLPGWTRLSCAHFMHVESNKVLFPLPAFCTPEAEKNYRPPVLAGTYSIKTLVDIGLAPKSALDKLGYRHYDRLEAIRLNDLRTKH